MTNEAWITLAAACVTGIVWLVRLEGRVNAADKALQQLKDEIHRVETAQQIEIAAIKARQDAETASHSETTLALVRLQEQVKHLTNLFERQFIATPSPRASRSLK